MYPHAKKRKCFFPVCYMGFKKKNGCHCKAALSVFQCDSEKIVSLEWLSFFPFKRLYSFCTSSFCSCQAILSYKNFCNTIHLEEKLGIWECLCLSECLSYSLYSTRQRVFCSLLYCNEGRKYSSKYRSHPECKRNWVLLHLSNKYTCLFFLTFHVSAS